MFRISELKLFKIYEDVFKKVTVFGINFIQIELNLHYTIKIYLSIYLFI
jgi:hypothetical protein